MYRALGPLVIVLEWIAGAILVRKWHEPGIKTLSQLSARYKHSYLLFASTLTAGAVLFYVFAYKWLIPTLMIPSIFHYLLLIALACQILTAWLPDHGVGKRSRWHGIFAYTLAFLLLPISGLIVSSPALSSLTTAIGILLITTMVFLWILAYWSEETRAKYIMFQIAYIICFHLIILSVVLLNKF